MIDTGWIRAFDQESNFIQPVYPLNFHLRDNNRSSAVGIVSDNQNGGCMLNLDTIDLNYNKTVAAFAIKKVLAEIGSAFVVDWL